MCSAASQTAFQDAFIGPVDLRAPAEVAVRYQAHIVLYEVVMVSSLEGESSLGDA